MFAIHDAGGAVDPAVIDDLLCDRLAFCVFRGAVAADECTALADAFSQSPHVRSRGDQVPGRTLGTIHYLKTLPQYLADSARARADLAAFFADRRNPLDPALQRLAAHLAPRGVTLRGAAFEGQPLSPMVMRAWQGSGDFSLLPHEDVSQLGHGPQQPIEFTRAQPTVGNINICLDNFASAEQGAVRLWDFSPDAAQRQRLGIDTSGYPYPLEVLARSASVQVPIFAGDIYVINGKYVHAVTGGSAGGRRVTLAAMLAFTDAQTCLHWS